MEHAIRPVILAVDDAPQQLELLGQILERQGYEVILAVDGAGALERLAARKPDLILLDIALPDQSGIEVCRIIKADPATSDIPVIFITGRANTEDILAGFQVGAADYVIKPFRMPELLARVRVHVDLCLARHEVRTLRGILPTCAHCKKIRDEQGTWHSMESFLAQRSEARVSHGICPDCIPMFFPDFEGRAPTHEP